MQQKPDKRIFKFLADQDGMVDFRTINSALPFTASTIRIQLNKLVKAGLVLDLPNDHFQAVTMQLHIEASLEEDS